MAAVAETRATVLFSSHVVSELERVCDHLVLLAGGAVVLSGEIDALLNEHCVLIGPSDGRPHPGTTISASVGERQTTLLIRNGASAVLPPWEAYPVTLERLVIAYLTWSMPGSETGKEAPG